MGSTHKSSLRIQPGQTIEYGEGRLENEPPILKVCNEFNVFSLLATLLPLIIQALDSDTARGSSSFTRRSNGQSETRSGNTNIRGPDVASTEEGETFGGITGMKDIIQEWVVAGG